MKRAKQGNQRTNVSHIYFTLLLASLSFIFDINGKWNEYQSNNWYHRSHVFISNPEDTELKDDDYMVPWIMKST